MDDMLTALEKAGIGRENADDAERVGMLANRAAYWQAQWIALYEKTRPRGLRCYVWPGCAAPDYKTAGAAGADCRARLEKPMVLPPGYRHKFPLGFAVEIPGGFELQVRARSGLAESHGIALVNGVGTVDSDYRGEVSAMLVNLGELPWIVNPGDRIAQVVLAPVRRAAWKPVAALEDLTPTERGAGGHGSTGVR